MHVQMITQLSTHLLPWRRVDEKDKEAEHRKTGGGVGETDNILHFQNKIMSSGFCRFHTSSPSTSTRRTRSATVSDNRQIQDLRTKLKNI